MGGHVHRLLHAFDERTLGKFKIHRISFFQPEEDENILLHIWDSFWISFLFPFMDELPNYQHFDEALPPERKRRIMKFYKSMLQRHMYATGKKYFVAKNPAFSPKIATLLELFPDARIIYLARNPLDMLPSTVSWINYARRQFTEPKEKYLYLDEIVDLTQHWYRYPLHYLDTHPSPRHLILNYDDLIQRPEYVIRSFYEQFGYPDKPGLDGIVDEAVKEALSFRSDHIYSYEEMGFTHRQILEMYADVFERFGFDKREDEISDVDSRSVVVSAYRLTQSPEEFSSGDFFYCMEGCAMKGGCSGFIFTRRASGGFLCLAGSDLGSCLLLDKGLLFHRLVHTWSLQLIVSYILKGLGRIHLVFLLPVFCELQVDHFVARQQHDRSRDRH